MLLARNRRQFCTLNTFIAFLFQISFLYCIFPNHLSFLIYIKKIFVIFSLSCFFFILISLNDTFLFSISSIYTWFHITPHSLFCPFFKFYFFEFFKNFSSLSLFLFFKSVKKANQVFIRSKKKQKVYGFQFLCMLDSHNNSKLGQMKSYQKIFYISVPCTVCWMD